MVFFDLLVTNSEATTSKIRTFNLTLQNVRDTNLLLSLILWRIPNLAELSIKAWQSSYFETVTDIPYLPSLTTLSLTGPRIASSVRSLLVSVVDCETLTTLELEMGKDPILLDQLPPNIKRLKTDGSFAVTQRLVSLVNPDLIEDLELSIGRDEFSFTASIGGQFLLKLFPQCPISNKPKVMPNLERMRINDLAESLSFTLRDVDVNEFVKIAPNIEECYFPVLQSTTCPSFASLDLFSRHCPRLLKLHMSVSTLSIFPFALFQIPNDRPVVPTRNSLILWNTAKSVSTQPATTIAAELYRLFPKLETVECGLSSKEKKFHGQRWKEVQDLVKVHSGAWKTMRP